MAAAVVGNPVMAQTDTFSIHMEPVWRDRSDFIVNAPLIEDGRFEQLWCRQVGVDRFEVCCIPFFLYDVALGDVVETKDAAGRQYVVSRVIQRSGRFVFRAHFDISTVQHRDATISRLAEMGALWEWSSDSLLAVDARDAKHGQEIADFLFRSENAGHLVYETGAS